MIATFGWGAGFYGPPIFLKAAQDKRNWSVAFVSGAVTPRVVALSTAISQAICAFAPAVFGLLREISAPSPGPLAFAAAAGIQALAATAYLAGGKHTSVNATQIL